MQDKRVKRVPIYYCSNTVALLFNLWCPLLVMTSLLWKSVNYTDTDQLRAMPVNGLLASFSLKGRATRCQRKFKLGTTRLRCRASALYINLPPSDSRACPSFLGRRSTPTRSFPHPPLPVDSPHLRLLGNCSFPPTRNRNRNHTYNRPKRNNSRRLSAHGLHMLPQSDGLHHHFIDIFMRFPRAPPPPANCFSLEASHPTVYAMTYTWSQRGISPQLS
jgi:hypothetical protein